MTAPIRDMAGLIGGTRRAQIEREISYQDIEHIAGLSSGTVAKYLGPNPSKRMGLLSTFLILQAMGKAIVIVEDPEQQDRVGKRFTPRIIKGGATLQMRAFASSLASVAGIEEQRKLELSNHMRELRGKVKTESLKNSGKSRMKKMKKRARQAMASHAARKRWGKNG